MVKDLRDMKEERVVEIKVVWPNFFGQDRFRMRIISRPWPSMSMKKWRRF